MGLDNRVDRLRGLMEDVSIDMLMVMAGPNMYYLSGYTAIALERLISLIIFREYDEIYLIIPKLEETRAEELVKLRDIDIIVYGDEEDPYRKVLDLVAGKEVVKVGIEGNTPYRHVAGLLSGDRQFSIEIADSIFTKLRIVKDQDEIKLLRKAAEINMKAMVEALSVLREGVSEKELMAIIRRVSLEFGGDETPFTIVQSGPYSSMPHQEPTDRIIKRGDIVLLDLGVIYRGYVSDITRTVVLGDPEDRHRKIFNIVLESQLSALDRVSPGVLAEEIDIVAREVIDRYGYGKYFIHRTGHGIGLDVHEAPYIREGSKTPLEPGMAFTVEPGIYLPNDFGVRLEDNVIVSVDGYINLTKLPKSLDIEEYMSISL
jgi:Xaa-Pro aminopeptidase